MFLLMAFSLAWRGQSCCEYLLILPIYICEWSFQDNTPALAFRHNITSIIKESECQKQQKSWQCQAQALPKLTGPVYSTQTKSFNNWTFDLSTICCRIGGEKIKKPSMLFISLCSCNPTSSHAVKIFTLFTKHKLGLPKVEKVYQFSLEAGTSMSQLWSSKGVSVCAGPGTTETWTQLNLFVMSYRLNMAMNVHEIHFLKLVL